MSTINIDRWRLYFKDRPCPDAWIDLGWYFCVASALARKVWYYNLKHGPLFTNLYIVLIGPPAVGKNLVIKPVSDMLRYWPYNPDDANKPEINGVHIKRLIETGPDTITFEKLVHRLSKATRRLLYTDQDGNERPYGHASMSLALEEINALFTRHNDRIPKLFLKTYDCGEYEYDTKHQGNDIVHNCCMNLLGGATPALLKEAEQYRIFEDGFISRTLFAFETTPRHNKFHIGEISEEQIDAFNKLAKHIKLLCGLFGQLTYSKEVYEYLEHWSTTTFTAEKAGSSSKMETYYGRKKVLVLKLAACMHLSEHLTLDIPLSCFQRAIEFLKPIEAKMAVGFGCIGRNELHPLTKDITKYLKSCYGGETLAGLLARFSIDCSLEELTSIMQTLQMSETVYMKGGKYYVN